MPPTTPSALTLLLSILGLCVGLSWPAASASAASISGVCPDGSIFIVQDRARIPCARAKEVAPSDIPPVRPSYLPRPYAWQVYREGANPDNPYNLIDAARRVREMQGNLAAQPGTPGVATTEIGPQPGFGTNPRGGPAPQGGYGTPPQGGQGGYTGGGQGGYSGGPQPGYGAPRQNARALALDSEEVRDLFLIVELAQGSAPGRFVKEDARGEVTLEVSFAYSAAFEAQAQSGLAASGRVVLFSVVAHHDDSFHPNFTFVQDHETFSPVAEDPRQIGFLEGRPGDFASQGVALGYVVLPDRMDLGRGLDLYWNDRRIETRLQP